METRLSKKGQTSASEKVQMATKVRSSKRALKQASAPRLSAPPPQQENVNEHSSIDCIAVMEEILQFFLRRAIETSDEEAAKKFERRKPRF